MTQTNKLENLSGLLRAACERKAKQEDKHTKNGKLKPYTSYRLHKDANIDAGHAYRVLNGQSFPSRDILVRICKALGCTQDEIAAIFAETDYRIPGPDEIEDVSSSENQAA